MNPDSRSRRVVITGMGVISPSGNDLATFWGNVSRGISAAGPVTRFDVSRLPTRIAGEVKGFDGSKFIKGKKPGRFDLTVQYSVAAATLAAEDARLDLNSIHPDRVCVIEGTTLSGSESVARVVKTYANPGNNFRTLHPYHVIGGYCGEGSSTISLTLGIRGHALTCCSGCASGNDAIGQAFRNIQAGEADAAVAGGSEELHELLHVGFCRIRSMTERNDNPAGSARPFDRNRDGFFLGEGAVFLVLEELSHALCRGARIYVEVAGYGRSAEAYHATDPHPDGRGYTQALDKAIADARILPSEVDYINAHGSGTPLNDPIETKAIKQVFKDHARRLSISATKPIHGHLMGASGAVEALATVLSIHHSLIPPTINLTDPDVGCDLDYVADEARPHPVGVALNLNAGFGGRYACLVFRKFSG